MRKSVWLCVVLAACTLQACGFRPRGSVSELTEPGSIYLDASRDLSIASALRDALQQRAFELAGNRDSSDILLRISAERQEERIVSVQKTGRISELELSHAVDMQIAEAIGDEAPKYDADIAPNEVEVFREYTYDERGVLGKENEARILREEMRQELVRQIVLRIIASLAPSDQIPIDQAEGIQ